MDDYERVRKVDRLEYEVDSLKTHRNQCDADMDAHGNKLLQGENRMNNLASDIGRLENLFREEREKVWKRLDESAAHIRNLQNFQLRMVTAGLVIGTLFGFIIKQIWK